MEKPGLLHYIAVREQRWQLRLLSSKREKVIASLAPVPEKPLIYVSANFEALSNLDKLQRNKSCWVVIQRFERRWIGGKWQAPRGSSGTVWLRVAAEEKLCSLQNIRLLRALTAFAPITPLCTSQRRSRAGHC